MTISELPTESTASEADVLLAALPAFALLPDAVRGLVAGSFELLELPFGAVIVREGEEADAFFVLASGSARVVKETSQGEEVALNVLQRGDAFGEAGLLGETTRTATVRTSSAAQVLRLHSSVFAALARSHPEVRTAFEAMGRTRELSDFFRIHAGFASLPNKALAQLITGLEEIEVAAGELVVREGDPPGPMFVIEEGRLRTFRMQDGARQDLAYLRKGDFFGERSLFRGEPRNASVEALIDCKLLRLPPALYASLLEEHPEFRARMEERILQYSYARLARVPLDFADEILPAEVSAAERDLGEPEARTPEPEEAEELGDEVAQGKRPGRRFPHVTQLDEMDCGAACLAMICRFFGRAVPISYIRDVAHTSTRGTSLNGITRGAGELGLVARSIRASKSRLDELPLPAVVHWQGDHWVVLYRVGKKKVRIADPESSLRTLPRDEFLKNWTGYASVIGYGEGLEQMPAARFSLAWLKPFFRPHYRMVAFATLLAGLVAGLELVLPILTQQIVDHVLPHRNAQGVFVQGDKHALLIVMTGIIAVLIAMSGAGLLQQYLLSRVAVRLDVSTLDHLTKTLFNLPMSYFATRRTGDIERRLAGAQQVRSFLTGSFIQALTSLLTLTAALTLMFIYSWVLALVYLATLPMYAGLMRFSSTRLRPLYDDLEASFGRYSSGQIDAIRGIETVKALAAENSLRLLMLTRFQALAKRIFRTQFIVLGYHGALQMVGLLSFGLFLGVGALEVINGQLTLGQFMAYNALIALANGPVLGLLSLWDGFQQTKVLLMRLDDVIEQEPEQGHDRSHLRAVGTLEGRVELQGVGFRYGGSGPILEDLTFKVAPGETIAIVGRSGSGKTTLVKLLAGLLEPTEGTISFDGFDMKTLDYRTLRRQIGFVLQENYLFNDSITGNIAFGEADAEPDKLFAAAKAANAHEFVQRLPLGYDTKIGESGLRLSGGQQQRVAIARALYHQPPILLFDEATSALDTESERAVKQSLDELLVGRTSFVIAHRLSTMRDADRILVLERGRLVEQGTHDELIARQGLYFYLASQQLEM
jgi:HlyB family type I secretion system ABC transporter